MQEYKWLEKYDIGHDEIDRQHQYFLLLINKIIKNKDKSPEILGRLCRETFLYAQFHFLSEENLMIISQYRDFEAHNNIHNELVVKLSNMLMQVESKVSNFEEFIEFLIAWFVNHTINEDQKLGFHLKNTNTNI